jgi:predicted glycosyltransferase
MNVWIDMDNSPHVPLLLPFIKSLEARGCTIFITARDYAQTLELLNNEEVSFTKIGKHAGANKMAKVIGLLSRTSKLLFYAKKKKIAFAINHGSRGQAMACKILGIPCYIGMDYEHTESKIFTACAAKIWIPELLFPAALPFIGISYDRALTYKGIKEQFYLKDFVSDHLFKEKHGIPVDKVLVVLRPPAEMANYHDHKSEALLENIIQDLINRKDIYTICTPRTKAQRLKLKRYESAFFKVLEKAIDGKNLVYYADTMISGGGTMNREAAFFGAHVYSIFSGKKPMLDIALQRMGLLSFIASAKDCNAIQFKRKSNVRDPYFNSESDQLEILLDGIIQNVKQKI